MSQTSREATDTATNALNWNDQTMQIKDHVFIVTGASSGIGLSTAIALYNRGAKVPYSLAAATRCKNWRSSFGAACLSR
jgi:NADPH:quinone reductase-like Zn-dependent oxidoreductase